MAPWSNRARRQVDGSRGFIGCDVGVDFFPVTSGRRPAQEYPPTVNDVKAAALASSVAASMFGDDAVVDVAPVIPAEDFLLLLLLRRGWPSAMMWLGAYNVTAGDVAAAQREVRAGRVGAAQGRGDARGVRDGVHVDGLPGMSQSTGEPAVRIVRASHHT